MYKTVPLPIPSFKLLNSFGRFFLNHCFKLYTWSFLVYSQQLCSHPHSKFWNILPPNSIPSSNPLPLPQDPCLGNKYSLSLDFSFYKLGYLTCSLSWLASLTWYVLRLVRLAVCIVLHSFYYKTVGYTTFIYFLGWTLGCFHFILVMNNAAMNFHVQVVSICFQFLDI